MLDELIVAELRKCFPDCRFAEHFLEPPARGLRPHFLAEKALETVTEFLGGPAEVRFENLADVHARRNAKRIQNDFHGRAIRKVRHVFLGHDARDDALVTVAASHLVADGELALHGDVDLNQLEDLRGFDGLVPLVLLSALTGEDFDVHDGALDARRAVERSIANVAGFFAEDGAEQLFFRSERGLALGRDLADKNVPGLHDRANADDTAFVEVAEEGLANVGNVASDFLGTELSITRFDFILLDVNRGVVIVFDQFFAHEDGVLEVVAAPGEKRHENVAAKREFATFGAGAVGQNLTLLLAVANANERLLADACVLVGELDFRQLVDIRAHFAAEHPGVIGFDAHDDAFGVHLIDNAFAFAEHDRAGVARGDALHACADQRRFAADDRHGLALHVGTHERAVGVVVLEERDQAGGNGDELLR